MMSYFIKTCNHDLTMSLMQASLKRENDRMELDRKRAAERKRRTLSHRMSSLEKESDQSARDLTQRIDSVSETAASIDQRLKCVEHTVLVGELKQRMEPRADLPALKAELDAAKAAYGELEEAYARLKAAVAAATSIEDLGWVPL